MLINKKPHRNISGIIPFNYSRMSSYTFIKYDSHINMTDYMYIYILSVFTN